MRFKEKASTFGAIRKSTQAPGSTIKCMDTVTSYGQTASSTKAYSRKTSDMVKEDLSGATVVSMKEDGIEGSSTVLVTTLINIM